MIEVISGTVEQASPAAEQGRYNHDHGDRLNAWPPLRELQNGQGNAHDKAGYTNAAALTTGSKTAYLTVCGESTYTHSYAASTMHDLLLFHLQVQTSYL